jgi:Receptor family ligand binding region
MKPTILRWFMCVFLMLLQNVACDKPKLRVIFIVGWTGSDDTSYGHRMGSAMALAIKEVENRNILPEYSLSDWILFDTSCDPTSLQWFAKNLTLTWKNDVHAFIGPSCMPTCSIYCSLASSMGIAQVSVINS